jgi:hypothetical protein
LSTIASQVHASALLVVTRRVPEGAPAESTASDAGPADDAGVALAPAAPVVTARLFLADSGDFDAARYEPEATQAGEGTTWRGTVASLLGRFPPPAVVVQVPMAPPKIVPPEKDKESRPFYASGWFWGAIGAAAVLGGIFFFTSQDTSNDPIHLQMRVPR